MKIYKQIYIKRIVAEIYYKYNIINILFPSRRVSIFLVLLLQPILQWFEKL